MNKTHRPTHRNLGKLYTNTKEKAHVKCWTINSNYWVRRINHSLNPPMHLTNSNYWVRRTKIPRQRIPCRRSKFQKKVLTLHISVPSWRLKRPGTSKTPSDKVMTSSHGRILIWREFTPPSSLIDLTSCQQQDSSGRGLDVFTRTGKRLSGKRLKSSWKPNSLEKWSIRTGWQT